MSEKCPTCHAPAGPSAPDGDFRYRPPVDRASLDAELLKQCRDVINGLIDAPIIYTGDIKEPIRTCGMGMVEGVLKPALDALEALRKAGA